MEQNKEMTAQESLKLISETLNNSRKSILRRNGRYFILWGILLTVFSLLVYILWKTTGNAAWNNLWFGMPVVGFPLARWIGRKEQGERVESVVSQVVSGIWRSFCVFACSIALFAVVFDLLSNSLGTIVAMASLTAMIAILFGFAETISGIALKNWTIKIAGFVTGIGGVIVYYVTGANEEQMLIFTLAGIVLVATGLIIRHQNE